MSFLDLNNTVEESGFDNINPLVQVTWSITMFYANNIPIPREDDPEDSSKGKTNMSDSSDETDLHKYDSDSDGSYCVFTLTIRGRTGSSTVPFTVNVCKTMQHVLDKYWEITSPQHALKQGIAL